MTRSPSISASSSAPRPMPSPLSSATCRRASSASPRRNIDVIIPGYTHLQRAQPVYFAHHLLAYVEMLERDAQRLADLRKRIDVMPLGSGAIAGSTIVLDRALIARELGFSAITQNSMDAVSDRDFACELLAAIAIAGMHLSRLSEDLILWASSRVRVHRRLGRLLHRLQPHAAEEKSRRRRTDARQNRPPLRQPALPAHHAQGAAAHLQSRHAGGQGARLRLRRYHQGRPRSKRRHARARSRSTPPAPPPP